MVRLEIAAHIYASMIGRSTRDISASSRSPLQSTAIRELADAALNLADVLIKAHHESSVYPATFERR
jgi:hypothetical protein